MKFDSLEKLFRHNYDILVSVFHNVSLSRFRTIYFGLRQESSRLSRRYFLIYFVFVFPLIIIIFTWHVQAFIPSVCYFLPTDLVRLLNFPIYFTSVTGTYKPEEDPEVRVATD